DGTLEREAAVVGRGARPATLGLLRQEIEAVRDGGGGFGRPFAVGQEFRIEGAGNRRLFDDEPRIAAVQGLQRRPDRERLVDDRSQIRPGAFLAVGQYQNRTLETALDQVVFECLVVLEVLFRRTA